MYKKVAKDKQFVTEGGGYMEPVVTLADEYGGRAQIAIDDACYVIYLNVGDGGSYRRTSWIFDEALNALKILPPPRETINRIILEEAVKNVEQEKYD